MNKQREVEQMELARAEFERLHEEGAIKLGTTWLQANLLVSKVQHEAYVPVREYGDVDIRISAMLTQVAWYVSELIQDCDKAHQSIRDGDLSYRKEIPRAD